MELAYWLENFWVWSHTYASNLIWSLVVLITYLIAARLALPKIETSVDQSGLKSESTSKAYHAARLLIGTCSVAALLLVWGIDFSGLLILSTSLLTLTGVALFANWSILSNITAYFILLFNVTYRRGNFVRIIDGDNYIEGYIADINLFSVKLITEEREVVMYPNNLILGRPTLVNPRTRLRTVGKTNELLLAEQNKVNKDSKDEKVL
ncbi:MAG: mechanosensitive ion channel domain-containing protein [Aestuariibacter sp.]